VIGLLNITRIFRRLALDFRDVFTAGISYDRISGDLQFIDGHVGVGDRFLLDGSGAKVFFGGSYDMFEDELNAEGVMIARVSNAAGLLALGAGFSPPVALMVIFGERVLERELERLFSVRTRITGSLAQPDVRASRLFDSNIRGNDATIEERMRELFGPEANR
ncbi:MAG: AsmA-like C-terminal region-containing protein, partial [Natronospirillum sp.]